MRALAKWWLVGGFGLAMGVGCAAESNDEADSDTAVEVGIVDEAKADHAGYQLALSRPQTMAGGRAATLRFQVIDGFGDPVSAFETDHTKLFHLIIVSRDLSYFTHIHPTLQRDGRFSVSWTPPRYDDSYYLYGQFRPTGLVDGVTIRLPLTVPGTVIRTPVPLTADTTTMKTLRGNVLMLDPPTAGFRVGAAKVRFMVHDASTGQMVTDLEPLLGARAHLIAIKGNADGRVFEHAHDMGAEMVAGGGGHAEHGGGGGTFDSKGMLSFDVRFPSRGLYRLWAQYRRDGRDATQFFTVNVR